MISIEQLLKEEATGGDAPFELHDSVFTLFNMLLNEKGYQFEITDRQDDCNNLVVKIVKMTVTS